MERSEGMESPQLREFDKKKKVNLFFIVGVSGEPFDMTRPINYAVSNIICSMVYGSRFDYDDPEFTSLVDRTNTMIQIAGSPSIMVRR